MSTGRPFQVIPAVDVLDGRVVRLQRGDYGAVTVYDDDPVGTARRWIDGGASLVHVVDLAAARDGSSPLELCREMAAAGVRFQLGGGLRTVEAAREALAAGAARVVLGTAAVWSPETLGSIGDPEAVVAAVDVRDGRATGEGWLDEGRPLEEVLDGLGEAGVRRLLVTGIGRDGTMEGPEISLLQEVLARRRFDVIASGGVGSLSDLERARELGCEGAIVGRALYEGRIDLKEALAAL